MNHLRTVLWALLCLFTTNFIASAQQNLAFQGKLTYSNELSDIWGYADDNGKEYALVGLFNGVSIVDVTDPANPNQVQFISGPNSTWRDIKVWNDYAYVTNESSGGLLIIDMTNLPTSVSTTNYTGGGLSSAHNIFIDENGYAYVVGSNIGVGGAVILNLNINPLAPTQVGVYSGGYIHDLFVRGDTMWTAEINNGYFAVVDVSNKAAPNQLATQATPSTFTHNVWLSDDGNTLLTTDEVSSAFVGVYDVSNVFNISQTDGVKSSPGTNVIPHNVFVRGDFAVVSYYRDGVVIFDITQPDNLIQVGNYDTSPTFSGGGFNGCWGVYPYLPSGNILASDIEEGLYVLSPTYTKGCYLRGTVTDFNTTGPLNNVSISISSSSATASTDFTGKYQTGVTTSGLYDVTYAKAGYVAHVETGVSLQNGVETIVDVALTTAVTYTLNGNIKDEATNIGIPDAQVIVTNSLSTYTAVTNSAGEFSIGGFPSDLYTVQAGKWGYVTKGVTMSLSPATNNFTIDLAEGYYDDFALDFNWTVNSSATTGMWVRGDPIGTDFNGAAANPGDDVIGDIGLECFMTGNGGGAGGTDDVDNGVTTLTSPSFDLSSYTDPYVSYDWWFYTGGGSIANDDTLIVRISNGSSTVDIQKVDVSTGSLSQWNTNTIRVADYLSPSSNMSIQFETSDLIGLGHIVEAAVDRFVVSDSVQSTACGAPDPTSTTILSYNSVNINWNGIGAAEKYQIRGRPLGSPNWVQLTVPDGATTNLLVQNLTTNVSYEWQIQAVCSEIDSIYSPYSSLDTFALLCAIPTNPNTINIEATTATVVWDPVPGTQQYNILGAVQGSSAIVSIVVGASTTSFTASGLSPATTYNWAVRSACSISGNVYSGITPIQVFTTATPKLETSVTNSLIDRMNAVRIYPNPASGDLTIKGINEHMIITIFDSKGQAVLMHESDGMLQQLDISHLAPGLYMIKVADGIQSHLEKVVIN